MFKIILFDGDKNDATLGLKLFGFLLVIIGGILLYFNF